MVTCLGYNVRRDGGYREGGWGQKWSKSHCPGRESNPRCSRLQTNPRGPVHICALQQLARVQSWGGALLPGVPTCHTVPHTSGFTHPRS